MADLQKYQTKEVLNKVLNSVETALQVDIVAGAEYAEDSEHTRTDTGNFVLGVRNDTLAALGGTDGDYVPFQMNASGALYVEVATGGGEDAVYVSRIREDFTTENGLSLWIVADNLRKGAALNTVQIAEILTASYLD